MWTHSSGWGIFLLTCQPESCHLGNVNPFLKPNRVEPSGLRIWRQQPGLSDTPMSLTQWHGSDLIAVAEEDISAFQQTPIFNMGKWYFLTLWGKKLCKWASSFLPPPSKHCQTHNSRKAVIQYFTDQCSLSPSGVREEIFFKMYRLYARNK